MIVPDVIEASPVERAIARAKVLGILGTNRPHPAEADDDDTED